MVDITPSILNEFKNDIWPLSRIEDKNLRLNEYAQTGSQDTFIYWIEKHLEYQGSIWGGSAFKFGIYSRLDNRKLKSERGRCYDDNYGWLRKYGDSPKEAFSKVKGFIVDIIKYSQVGNFRAIDDIDLGEAYKWKIAFHYQDFDNLNIVPIFKREALEEYLGVYGKSISELQAILKAEYPEKYKDFSGLHELASKIWDNFSTKERNSKSRKDRMNAFKAAEGQKVEVRLMLLKRNQPIVNDRKKLDNYTCQNPKCSFSYNGYIVEAHHLKPLSKKETDIVFNTVDDLITLCPTCHRLAHRLLEKDKSLYDANNLRAALAKVIKK